MKSLLFFFIVFFTSYTSIAQLVGDKKQEFNKYVRDADVLFSQNKFLEAKETYEKALSLDPNDKYVLNQRDKSIVNSKSKTGEEEDKNYQKIINKADEKFNSNDFQNAKSLYQRALGLKPNDPYPKRKIEEIDAVLNPKPVEKSAPLPDLGISTKLSSSDAEKILIEADNQRKNIKNTKILNDQLKYDKNQEELSASNQKDINDRTSNINNVNKNIDAKNINTKIQQDSLSVFIQNKEKEISTMNSNFDDLQVQKNNNINSDLSDKKSFLDSLSYNTKTAGAEMDVYITVKTKRFSDSITIAEQKIKDDMSYKIAEIKDIYFKDEKKLNDVENQNKMLINKLDSTLSQMEVEAFDKNIEFNIHNSSVNDKFKKIESNNDSLTKSNSNQFADNDDFLKKNIINLSNKSDSISKIPIDNSNKVYDKFIKTDDHIRDSLNTLSKSKKEDLTNQILAIHKVVSSDEDNIFLSRDKASKESLDLFEKLKEDNFNLQNQAKDSQDSSIQSLKKIQKKSEEIQSNSFQNELNDTYNSMDQIKTSQSKISTGNSESNLKSGDNSMIISGKTNVLNGNSTLENQKQNDKRQDVRDYLENLDGKKIKFDEKAANSLGAMYPEGVTEESFNKNDDQGLVYSVVTRRIVVVNGYGSIYTKTQTKNSITYSKNGQSTTEYVWQLETQDAKLKRN
jgi:epidermal growth factor receptor substrate 15